MIIDISPAFASQTSKKDWCEIMHIMNRNHHYFMPNKEVYNTIQSKIKETKCQIAEETFKSFVGRTGFKPTKELQQFLSILNVDTGFNLNHLKTILSSPGYLICENCNYEWAVYEHFCHLYSKERRDSPFQNKYSNIIAQLDKAIKNNLIIGVGSGGDGQLKPTYDYLKQTTWRGNPFLLLKCCFLFDRDTDNDESFSKDHKHLFIFLNKGKDETKTTHEDIYTLKQEGYIWHMWYKRAIENYISDRCYASSQVDISQLSAARNRDYFEIKRKFCNGYEKRNLGAIARLMDYPGLEGNVRRFQCDQYNLSEIQLFLLKLVKTI